MAQEQPFDPAPPRTQADYVRETWRLVSEEVIPRQDKTNGRVTRLEFGALVALGISIGLGIREFGPLLLPLFASIRFGG